MVCSPLILQVFCRSNKGKCQLRADCFYRGSGLRLRVPTTCQKPSRSTTASPGVRRPFAAPFRDPPPRLPPRGP
jgi:hypothetical protein